MKFKKYNNALICSVLVLLWVTILALVKVLFHGGNKLEWGSVSDWFNTAGTLGTLAIAYFAYKKAPEWINRKIDEDALTLGTESYYILIEDIQTNILRIRNLINHPRNRIYPFSSIIQEVVDSNGDIEYKSADSLWAEFKNCISFDAFPEVATSQIKLVKNLNRLKFMGWMHNPDKAILVNKVISDINKLIHLKFEINNIIEYAQKESRCFRIAPSDKNIIDRLEFIPSLVYPLEVSMDNLIKELLVSIEIYKSTNGEFFDYFTKNKSAAP